MSVPPTAHASHANTFMREPNSNLPNTNTKPKPPKPPQTTTTSTTATGSIPIGSINTSTVTSSISSARRSLPLGSKSSSQSSSSNSSSAASSTLSSARGERECERAQGEYSIQIGDTSARRTGAEPSGSPRSRTTTSAFAFEKGSSKRADDPHGQRLEMKVGSGTSGLAPSNLSMSGSASSSAESSRRNSSRISSNPAESVFTHDDMIRQKGRDSEKHRDGDSSSTATRTLGHTTSSSLKSSPTVERERDRTQIESTSTQPGAKRSHESADLAPSPPSRTSEETTANRGLTSLVGSKPSKSASSTKKSSKSTRTQSTKKKQKLLTEQMSLTEQAAIAAALLAEKRELEARIAAKESAAQAEQLHIERVNEATRLYEEAESDQAFNREREEVLVKLEEAVYESQAWDSYLACNPLPDVTDPPSLNAYVSAFREFDTVNPPHLTLKPALEACTLTEQVITELQRRIANAREEKNSLAISNYERYVYLLRELSAAKLVDVTCKFLHRSDEYEAGEECAFTQCAASDSIGYGLWVHNSSRTARIKRIDFGALNIQIELPQSLQKARTAIRLIRTNYDHVSVKKATPVARSTSSNPSAQSSTSSLTFTRPATRGSSETKTSLQPLQSLIDVSDTAFTDPIAIFDFDLHPPPTDARAHFVSVGGVIELHQLLLPPPAKKLRSWTMREVTPLEKQLVVVPYPSEENSSNAGMPPSISQQAPLRIRFTLAHDIYLADREPVFGYWYENSNGVGQWRQEGVNILDYDLHTRQVSLSVPTINPIACIQPRALDFPYRSWSITPMQFDEDYAEPSIEEEVQHTCRIEVTGSRFSVGFQLFGLLARLDCPSNSALRQYNQDWTTPGLLTDSLNDIGIRVTPSDADAQYCRKPLKNPTLVQTLHSHLSLLTQVFDITSSSHNVSRPSNACTFRIRLNRRSKFLVTAAARKAVLDWTAQAEEDERMDREDESYKNFPDALRQPTEDELAEVERQAEIDERIRQLELADAKVDAQFAETVSRQSSAQSIGKSKTSATSLNSDTKSVTFDETHDQNNQKLTREQLYGRSTYNRQLSESNNICEDRFSPLCMFTLLCCVMLVLAIGYDWVTVLAELIESPSDPRLAAAAAAAYQPQSALPTSGRSLTAAERATGSIHEGLPPGVLLRFTLIQGDAVDGTCDLTPLPNQIAHFSLRRCLLAYFIDKTPHDLTTAMGMAKVETKHDPSGESSPSSSSSTKSSPPQYHFIPFDAQTLQTQQTVRRTLNLLRPFVFC